MVTEYVNRIAQNLVRNSDAKVPFTIKVIDSEEINAFAFPGGFLFVNYGVILAAEQRGGIGQCHGSRDCPCCRAPRHEADDSSANVQLGVYSSHFCRRRCGSRSSGGGWACDTVGHTKFARSFEAEADYLGVEYLYKAGYDPQALISFFERVQAGEKQKPGFVAKAFSTHPQTSDRIKKTQREIDRILPARETYVLSTSEFEDVKSRLAIFHNPSGHVSSGQIARFFNAGLPKRTPAATITHPTLKRRDNQ